MKNKRNNQGFTLIELLAVVVIMLAISVMAISSISAAIERNKEKQNAAKIEVIESYARLYYEKNKNSLSSKSGSCILINKLDLNDKEKVDANGNTFTGGVRYTISGGKVTFKYDSTCK